jgi:hypothetical protein
MKLPIISLVVATLTAGGMATAADVLPLQVPLKGLVGKNLGVVTDRIGPSLDEHLSGNLVEHHWYRWSNVPPGARPKASDLSTIKMTCKVTITVDVRTQVIQRSAVTEDKGGCGDLQRKLAGL